MLQVNSEFFIFSFAGYILYIICSLIVYAFFDVKFVLNDRYAIQSWQKRFNNICTACSEYLVFEYLV